LSIQREKLERIDGRITNANKYLEIASSALASFSNKVRLEKLQETREDEQISEKADILVRLRKQALVMNRELDYQNRLMDNIIPRCDTLTKNMGKFN
jgi:hypothetical protein